MAPRQNVGTTERIVSVATGAVLSAIATRRGGAVGIILATLAAGFVIRGTTGGAPIRRLVGPGPDDQAAAKQAGWSSAAVVSRAVTINKPRQKVYDYFRDFSLLPTFMVNLDSVVETSPTRSHWTVIGPGGVKLEWDADITADFPGERIAWTTAPGARVPNHGDVEFRDAPGGRGTEVHATIVYRPPGGTVGKLAAKLFQREPGIQARRDLKRLKMLLEAGEIATNAPQGAAPKA